VIDITLVVLSILTAVYVQFNAERFIHRWAFSDPVFFWDNVFGLIVIVLILEGSRRVMGMSLTIIVMFLLAYAFWGQYIPGLFGHRGFSLSQVVEINYMTSSGIYGSATKVSSTFAFIFIIFGAFLKLTGGGDFFFDIAQRIAGFTRGGIAKTAVIASAFFGSLSGSPIANAATTGTITIPMMKKSGYPSVFAAAVETAASCGGPIMPPVMGAVAFLMAEIIGVSYFTIISVAFIPAAMYFAAIFIQIDSEAVKLGLTGIPRNQLPPLKRIWAGVVHFFFPLAWLIIRLFQGYTPTRAGLETTVILIIFTMIRRRGIITIKEFVNAFSDSVKTTISVAIACSAAGVIIGIVTLTGIAPKFTALIMNLGQEMVFISLVLAMIVSLFLGMPLNITPTYILTASLAGPALTSVGLPILSVHLFFIYYAAMGSLTPPIALTGFTAASIAGANPMEVSWRGWRLALTAFVVPFAFIYRPGLLHFDQWWVSVEDIFFTGVSLYALVAGVDGFLVGFRHILPRIFLIGLFLMLFIPKLQYNLIALPILAGMIVLGRYWQKRKRPEFYHVHRAHRPPPSD